MITITNKYEVDIHNSQLDIFKTNFDELKYNALFIEFADLCCKYDNKDRFGLCLRHHFDLKRGEVSMREILKDEMIYFLQSYKIPKMYIHIFGFCTMMK